MYTSYLGYNGQDFLDKSGIINKLIKPAGYETDIVRLSMVTAIWKEPISAYLQVSQAHCSVTTA